MYGTFMAGETGSLRSAAAACSACMPARVLALPNLRLRSFANAKSLSQNPTQHPKTTKMTRICIRVIFVGSPRRTTFEPNNRSNSEIK